MYVRFVEAFCLVHDNIPRAEAGEKAQGEWMKIRSDTKEVEGRLTALAKEAAEVEECRKKVVEKWNWAAAAREMMKRRDVDVEVSTSNVSTGAEE